MAHHIEKANKAFTIGEEMILPASMDICRKLLGEAVAKKIALVFLLAALFRDELKI